MMTDPLPFLVRFAEPLPELDPVPTPTEDVSAGESPRRTFRTSHTLVHRETTDDN
jgi:hypothetical protein